MDLDDLNEIFLKNLHEKMPKKTNFNLLNNNDYTPTEEILDSPALNSFIPHILHLNRILNHY